MIELEQLLEQANASEIDAQAIRRIFAQRSGLTGIARVDIEPTIRQSLDLRSLTAVPEAGRTSTPQIPNHAAPQAKLGRYIDAGVLGTGGMGEVRRVQDPDLNRRLAMKIIHPKLLKLDAAMGRFVEEAQVVAQLQHPNIIPIHEIGKLEDGRLYFTMKEVQGRPLSEIIADVHAASTDLAWQPTADGWTFRKLIDVFAQVCAATSFAHSRGVVHRDLKPENILVGQFDEVLVVDWGIAKIITELQAGASESSKPLTTSRGAAQMTRMGEVAGTPAYMAPEQARGQIDRIDARTDIYALGAILYEILSGRCPYGGSSSKQVLSKVILGPPPSVRTTIMSSERVTGTIELDFFDDFEEDDASTATDGLDDHNSQGVKLPEDLVAACERAMQRQPQERFQHADDLKQVVLDWLDGAKKRDKALDILAQTHHIQGQAETLNDQAQILAGQASAAQSGKQSWTHASEFEEGWKLEDQAQALTQEASLLATQREQLLKGALTHVADLPEVHAELVLEYQKRHQAAENAQEEQSAVEARMGMQLHLDQLPIDHPLREEAATYLEGTGALSLTTDTPGAKVFAASYRTVNRRLVLEDEVFLGHAPLNRTPLAMGSYVMRLSQEGRHDVTYPIRIGRLEHWSGQTPEGKQPPIELPRLGTLGDDECYIPAGPFTCGGDAGAPEGLPKARIWVDGFIIRRYQVTYAEYRTYLQALHDTGRIEAFKAALPVHEAAGAGTTGASCFSVEEDGTISLAKDPQGIIPNPQWPIAFVNFRQAVTYAKWLAESTGQKWRILNEFEWEKAARGVDGRIFPWGNAFAPTWCNMELSQAEKGLNDVNSHPVDCSVYGVRGMSGNLSQWTSSEWQAKLELAPYQNIPEQTSADVTNVYRVFRGGGWMLPEVCSRGANRVGFDESDGVPHVGFRVGRTLD